MKKEMLYGPAVILAVWYAVQLSHLINPLFLPPPHEVAKELLGLLFTAGLWNDIAASAWRIAASFALACVIGVAIGLLMGYYRGINSAFEMLVDFSRSLPALAIFPLMMLFLGIGDMAKIATAAFSCSLIIAIHSAYGVAHSKKTRQIVATLMGATHSERFIRVTLPEALPQILVGMRITLSFAVSIIIVTEMFVSTNNGIGHRIFEAGLTYKTTEMYSMIIIAGMFGYLLNKAFMIAERRAVHWSGK